MFPSLVVSVEEYEIISTLIYSWLLRKEHSFVLEVTEYFCGCFVTTAPSILEAMTQARPSLSSDLT